jgi:hypothetical protein
MHLQYSARSLLDVVSRSVIIDSDFPQYKTFQVVSFKFTHLQAYVYITILHDVKHNLHLPLHLISWKLLVESACDCFHDELRTHTYQSLLRHFIDV